MAYHLCLWCTWQLVYLLPKYPSFPVFIFHTPLRAKKNNAHIHKRTTKTLVSKGHNARIHKRTTRTHLSEWHLSYKTCLR